LETYTPNLNLKKPDQLDFYDVDDFNGNMDIIDEKIGELGDTDLDSVDLTGTPTAPTPPPGDNSNKIATTAYVKNELNTVTTQVTSNLNNHLTDELPHRFIDGGVTYKWGLKVISGVVNFVYEPV